MRKVAGTVAMETGGESKATAQKIINKQPQAATSKNLSICIG